MNNQLYTNWDAILGDDNFVFIKKSELAGLRLQLVKAQKDNAALASQVNSLKSQRKGLLYALRALKTRRERRPRRRQ